MPLLKSAPNIRNLTLFTPTMPLSFSGCKPLDLPNLRKAAFMPCNSKHIGGISLKGLLKSVGQQAGRCWDDFEGMEIVQHTIGKSQPMGETSSIDKITVSSSSFDLMSR